MHLRRALTVSPWGLLAVSASPAWAHPGHAETASFAQGLAHPLSGIDHMLAIVMVGLFAVQIGGKALWALPTAFVGAMAVGSLTGAAGLAPSLAEFGIGLSVVVLGALIGLRLNMPIAGATMLVSVIALFHGNAHGAEAPAGVSVPYLVGFLVSTAFLHATGVIAGLAAKGLTWPHQQFAARVVGGLGAGAGLVMLAAH